MQSPNQPNATVNVSIQQFRPLGGIFPITATFQLDPSTPPVFELSGKSIIVRTMTPTSITFQLADSNYVLLGVAFEADGTATPSSGRAQFPQITIQRTQKGSSLQVQDQGTTPTPYSYLLLVQQIATGEIGVIDPSIENEPE
jgi:hypothetical protein